MPHKSNPQDENNKLNAVALLMEIMRLNAANAQNNLQSAKDNRLGASNNLQNSIDANSAALALSDKLDWLNWQLDGNVRRSSVDMPFDLVHASLNLN